MLSVLLGEWVQRNHPNVWESGMVWSISEYSQEAYRLSELTQDGDKYSATIYGEKPGSSVSVEICDQDSLFEGKFRLSSFLEDLFAVHSGELN